MKHFSAIAHRLAVSCIAVVGATFLSQAAWATACVPGHNTVFPPCTFDGGALSLDSSSTPDLGGSGGMHNTQVTFPVDPTLGPGIEIAASPTAAFPTFSALHDGTNGVSTASITLAVSTVSGASLIHDVSLMLLNPVTTGTGTISFSLDGVTHTIPSGTSLIDIVLPNNVNSISDTLSIILTAGTGDASVTGAEINYSLVPVPVPEPASLAIFGTALAGLGLLRRRRNHDRTRPL